MSKAEELIEKYNIDEGIDKDTELKKGQKVQLTNFGNPEAFIVKPNIHRATSGPFKGSLVSRVRLTTNDYDIPHTSMK